MNQDDKEILRRVDTWPTEDQEELVEAAREIEARRASTYRLSDEERAAIERGHRVFRALSALRCPTVAVIHGICLGGGTEPG